MQFFEILIYSLVQGFTEFLPISSSAHLYFLEASFDWSSNGVLYALAAHLGTLIAVLYYQRKHIYYLLKNSLYLKNEYKYLLCIIVCSFPVIIIGAILSFYLSNFFNSVLFFIASASIIGGVLLDFADNHKQSMKINTKITLRIAFFTGIFQILALIPGMSRSGTVITALRMFSINRYESIRFSLLSGIPILIIASMYGIYKITGLNKDISYIFFIITFISFISALISIRFLISWVQKFSFRIFSIYRIIFGSIVFIYLIY